MSNSSSMLTLSGLATARGFAVGTVFVYRGDGDLPVPEYSIAPEKLEAELARMRRAHVETERDLENLISVLRTRTGRDDVKVFECHLMMLEDPMLVGETKAFIEKNLVNAEAAVRHTATKTREQFSRMNDPYFRERVRDLDDIERRLLKALGGVSTSPHLELKTPSIVVADDLTPSETVQIPRDLVLGFATNGGSTTSHVALLARAMGIPAVTGLGDVTARVTAGETMLLDGTAGEVILHPNTETLREFIDLIERQKELSEEACTGLPAGTLKSGGEVLLYANMHPGVPVRGLRELGARGVGLYRSEYLWLNREREPSEEEQFAAYANAAKVTATLGDRATITIRALDIGGDKLVRGISTKESNPFLGNRSIRYLLSHPDVFEAQLRAILRASAFGRICLMYPMISCVEELRACAETLARVKTALDAAGIAYDRNLPVGAMIEVPSAAVNANALAKYVDFFSIGTNDLVQYTMAADRGNETVASLYQPTNPAVLKLMRMTIDAAKRNGIYVGVCGESAADPIIGVLWAAMGIDMLSMSATYIPVIAKLLSRLSRADLDDYAKTVEALDDGLTGAEVFGRCRQWMAAHIADLDNILL